MFNADGQLIDQNAAPIVYLHGGYDNILPAVEAALENKKAGDQVVVELSPEDGFGEYDADYMRRRSQCIPAGHRNRYAV
jgi:FKBP-type peptidyl-prolyl cis-trans isomerase SlyD